MGQSFSVSNNCKGKNRILHERTSACICVLRYHKKETLPCQNSRARTLEIKNETKSFSFCTLYFIYDSWPIMHLVQRFRDSDCLCDEQTKSRPARKQTAHLKF